MKEQVDKAIQSYQEQTGKTPAEIRLSVNNYKELKHELENIPWTMMEDPRKLQASFLYKGITITWGV